MTLTPSTCSQPKLMHALLSPYGHGNIVTRIPRGYAGRMAEVLARQHLSEWLHVDFAGASSTGSNSCFWMTNGPDADPDWVTLHWKPGLLEDCLLSYAALRKAFDQAYRDAHGGRGPLESLGCLTDPALILNCEVLRKGYKVQASFSPPVWELLASHSGSILPKVNYTVRAYWEDHLNREAPGQYGTFWEGKDGPTFQMMHPVGSELSVAGAQQPQAGLFQITDHNTDTPVHALGHIVALCAVVDVCCEIWPAVAQQPVLQFA